MLQPNAGRVFFDVCCGLWDDCMIEVQRVYVKSEAQMAKLRIAEANVNDIFIFFNAEKYQGSLPLLEQILHCDTRHRIFVLCGDENEGTTVSGAGKTTMLQHLYYSWENAIFVPLSRVYCNHRYSIRRDMKHSDAYILPWLQKYYKIWKQSDLDNRLLILDGLDEIREASGVQAICDDLFWLIEKCTPRIVISSKLRPDKLTTWDYEPTVGLCTVSDYVWRVAEYCYILPMNKDQRRKYLGDNVSPELESILTTGIRRTILLGY